jgi:manganese/iron transport system substrate-binding protein
MSQYLDRRSVLASGLALVPASALAQTAARGPLKVITTFTVLQDMALNVAGKAATVEALTRPGAEIHGYEPTPRDIVRAQGAQLVLWNGMNLEAWFERFFANVKGVPSAILTEGITPIPIRDGAYASKPNPHAWMSAANALVYVENIRKALAAADPANAETYAKNATAYAAKIKSVAEPLKQRLARIPAEQRWLVTSEGAFSYLARDLDLREAYLWPMNTDEQGTPQQVRRLVDLVRANKIPVVFSESTVSDKPARQVARETGARYGGVLYVDSLSEKSGPVPTYLDLLRVSVETIAKGFNV